MARVYNFSAGPSMLPIEVLETAAAEMTDWHGTGESVMEMSHRSKEFEEIIKTAEQDLRDLYKIPDNYKVLFLQGGASAQFSAVPLNFVNGTRKPTTSSPVSGRRRLIPKPASTATRSRRPAPPTRPSPISPKPRGKASAATPITCTSA